MHTGSASAAAGGTSGVTDASALLAAALMAAGCAARTQALRDRMCRPNSSSEALSGPALRHQAALCCAHVHDV